MLPRRPGRGNGRARIAGTPHPEAGAEAGPGAASVEEDSGATARYGRGARVLSIGIGTTGLVTFAYFAVASQVLDAPDYGRITLVWALMFITASVIYRPIEQLLSRTIAERRARGLQEGHPMRVPGLIQAGFAVAFALVALALREALQDEVFDGVAALYWILVAGVLAYAASYFARGWLAGHLRFGLYGGLVLLEATSRFGFALAAAVGLTHGQTAVAMGMAAAPFVSLVVVPWAFARRGRAPEPGGGESAPAPRADDLTLARGTGFAASVFAIQLAEQALLNVAVLTVTGAAVAGFVFNVLLIARAPLQLFQSIQTSLLPHLAGLEATAGGEDFRRAIRVTVGAIAAFAGLVALGLLAVGPFAMDLLFGSEFHYARGGLALVALGMGLHLVAGTLNQAALARGQAGLAAGGWLLCAALFVGWLTLPAVHDQVLRVEVGYFGATGILSVLLYGLYRRG